MQWLFITVTLLLFYNFQCLQIEETQIKKGTHGSVHSEPKYLHIWRSRLPKHLVALGMRITETVRCSVYGLHNLLSHADRSSGSHVWQAAITQWCKTPSFGETHIEQLFWLRDTTEKSSLSSLAEIITVFNRKEINKEMRYKSYGISHCSIDMKCVLLTVFPNV